MLVGNVNTADSHVGRVVCVCVTTEYITPTALFSDKLSSGLYINFLTYYLSKKGFIICYFIRSVKKKNTKTF